MLLYLQTNHNQPRTQRELNCLILWSINKKGAMSSFYKTWKNVKKSNVYLMIEFKMNKILDVIVSKQIPNLLETIRKKARTRIRGKKNLNNFLLNQLNYRTVWPPLAQKKKYFNRRFNSHRDRASKRLLGKCLNRWLLEMS